MNYLVIVLRPAQEMFHFYGNITIAGERLQNIALRSVLRVFKQGGIFILPKPLVIRGLGFFWSHPKDSPIQSPFTTPKWM
jgi:hypothetical protein